MKIPSTIIELATRSSATRAILNITDEVPIALLASEPPFAIPVDPGFNAVSLEFQYWPTYGGNATGQPNEYMSQLWANMGERTGKTPPIRIGGTSENQAYVDTSLQLWNASDLTYVYGPFTSATRGNTSIGRDWYALAGNLPAGTDVTFGVNLYEKSEVAKQSEMLAEAFQGSRSLTKDINLQFIQVGNEPNFYFDHAFDFVSHWTSLAHTLLKHIALGGKGEPTLWIGSEVQGVGFQLAGTLQAGILDDEEIASANFVLEEHQYSGAGEIGAVPGGPPPVITELITWPKLVTMLRKVPPPSLPVYKWMIHVQANLLGNESEGIFGLSNTGEAAIWAVDYMLMGASMGVRRVYLHSTPNRMFSSFMPGWGFPNGTQIERPHIMPKYNGLLVVNEMIGRSGVASVAEVETGNAQLAAYGAWEHGKLARMVLINSNVAERNVTRSAMTVTLKGDHAAGRATAKRLSIPYTTATQDITWAGQSFETIDGAPSGDVVEEPIDGLSVTIAATEVVMLSFTD
ncbi:uncharacterized protein LTR77_010293 [Saxophila tyrrhenica]|uniref:Beta-glucuronidase C-terminal domain-containing protein n=1 Tax=Saxophila tyrrhenica TaxID=1690608 RepID=A0AAV9NY98_9PEZI|nr:hypothetical protein LTR77_010293 [Saxophila tyrrhenica]